jgi:hypothetical protein
MILRMYQADLCTNHTNLSAISLYELSAFKKPNDC